MSVSCFGFAVDTAACQPAAVPHRHGGLHRGASSQSQTSGAWPRRPADAGEIRAAYCKGEKNDYRDAEAIAEAVQRPTMKFVVTKTADQLDLQALHRVRERLVSQRTGIINQIRAFLLERGIAVRQGTALPAGGVAGHPGEAPDVLSPRMVRVIEGLASDWRRLDERIEGLSSEIEELAQQDQGCERLMSMPGIGPIISSAMVAAIGTGDASPKVATSAHGSDWCQDRSRLGTERSSATYRGAAIGIYARCSFRQPGSFCQGGTKQWERHGLRPWIEAAKKRLHHNVLAIALANKLARIAWAVLHHGRAFETSRQATAS